MLEVCAIATCVLAALCFCLAVKVGSLNRRLRALELLRDSETCLGAGGCDEHEWRSWRNEHGYTCAKCGRRVRTLQHAMEIQCREEGHDTLKQFGEALCCTRCGERIIPTGTGPQ